MLPLILCLVIGVASGLLTVDYHVDFRKGSFSTTSVEKVRGEKMGLCRSWRGEAFAQTGDRAASG
jgi:hypothetical protein